MEYRNCPYYDSGLGGHWCDKVGGYNCRLDYCSDIYDVETRKKHSKQKRRNKRERD